MDTTKFLNKKKWDLSRKSNDEVDSKRPTVSSLDESILNSTNTDVFNESLKSEDCVVILYGYMKRLEE